jgi:hypothetical protein
VEAVKEVFAIDVGGVLASLQHDGEPMPGALKTLRALEDRFELWVVSQCGKNRALRTAGWLAAYDFPIPDERQIYIRFGEKKAPVLSRIDAAYFIDDRMKHVFPALEVVRRRVFHLAPTADEALAHAPRYKQVADWKAVADLFEVSL